MHRPSLRVLCALRAASVSRVRRSHRRAEGRRRALRAEQPRTAVRVVPLAQDGEGAGAADGGGIGENPRPRGGAPIKVRAREGVGGKSRVIGPHGPRPIPRRDSRVRLILRPPGHHSKGFQRCLVAVLDLVLDGPEKTRLQPSVRLLGSGRPLRRSRRPASSRREPMPGRSAPSRQPRPLPRRRRTRPRCRSTSCWA